MKPLLEMTWGEFSAAMVSNVGGDEDALALYSKCAATTNIPKDALESFSMHAPLELMARYILLPRVARPERARARLQMAAMAKFYAEQGDHLALPMAAPRGDRSGGERMRETVDAVLEGKTDTVLAALRSILETSSASSITDGFADLMTRSISCGAHGHIFLHLLGTLPVEARDASKGAVLGYLKEISRAKERLIPLWDGASESPPPRLATTVSAADRLLSRHTAWERFKEREPGGITGILRQFLDSGQDATVDAHLAEFRALGGTALEAVTLSCRIAVLSMLQESHTHAKYGWTHALTLPQAVWGLTSRLSDPWVAAKVASVQIAAYRTVIAERDIVVDYAPPPPTCALDVAVTTSPEEAMAAGWRLGVDDHDAAWNHLATAASIRADCHCVKYVLACLESAKADPGFEHAYLAAAAKLVSIWVTEIPDHAIATAIRTR